jgi:hypothetical protein
MMRESRLTSFLL